MSKGFTQKVGGLRKKIVLCVVVFEHVNTETLYRDLLECGARRVYMYNRIVTRKCVECGEIRLRALGIGLSLAHRVSDVRLALLASESTDNNWKKQRELEKEKGMANTETSAGSRPIDKLWRPLAEHG